MASNSFLYDPGANNVHERSKCILNYECDIVEDVNGMVEVKEKMMMLFECTSTSVYSSTGCSV